MCLGPSSYSSHGSVVCSDSNMTVYTEDQNACLWFHIIYFSKNMDCPGRCEYKYCHAELVVVLDVFDIFLQTERYKSVLLFIHKILFINHSLDSTGRKARELYELC